MGQYVLGAETTPLGNLESPLSRLVAGVLRQIFALWSDFSSQPSPLRPSSLEIAGSPHLPITVFKARRTSTPSTGAAALRHATWPSGRIRTAPVSSTP